MAGLPATMLSSRDREASGDRDETLLANFDRGLGGLEAALGGGNVD